MRWLPTAQIGQSSVTTGINFGLRGKIPLRSYEYNAYNAVYLHRFLIIIK